MVRNFIERDSPLIEALVETSYGRPYEAWLIQNLRSNQDLIAEFVYAQADQILGHICFARHRAPQDWWSLCTVAVAPDARKQGYGSVLVRHGLEQARHLGVDAISVLGNAGFYQRFGFTRCAARNLDTPFSLENTLLYPIRPELAGHKAELKYPNAFSRL